MNFSHNTECVFKIVFNSFVGCAYECSFNLNHFMFMVNFGNDTMWFELSHCIQSVYHVIIIMIRVVCEKQQQ